MLSTTFHTVLLLIAGSISLTAAQDSSFDFSSCASDCIGNTGCGTNRPTCMCLAAKGSLLDTVIQCMSKRCPDSLGTVEADLLNPMQTGCTAISQPIPDDDIQEAGSVASSLASKLAPATTSEAPATSSTPEPTAEATTTAEAETTSESEAPTTTESPSTTETEAAATTTEETDAAVSTKTAESRTTTLKVDASSSTTKGSSTKTKGSSDSDPTDSSPFANANSSSITRASFLFTALSLALTMTCGILLAG